MKTLAACLHDNVISSSAFYPNSYPSVCSHRSDEARLKICNCFLGPIGAMARDANYTNLQSRTDMNTVSPSMWKPRLDEDTYNSNNAKQRAPY